ncbi:aminotransferase [Alphaproteobacteria bacterium 46_93_T64]|nr:aminotransferase [Alphaproteobacteria bacterium 46_93_T64]
MLSNQRHLFDIPEEIAYFNCGYMGPLSKSVSEAGVKGVLQKASPWKMTPQDFFTNSDTLRKLFADLVNASPTDIALIPSASYGLAIAAKNIPLKEGQTILVLEEQFPSNIYCWQERCKETGAKIVTVAAPVDRDWTSAVLEKIDSSVAVAALPHNHWADGGLLDLVKIAAELRKRDAKLVLDVTQSLGAMPLDVKAIQPDFLIVAAYKWLLGPYSVGMMYVSPENQQGSPIEHNWLNRAGSENFSGLVNYQDDYQNGAVRYDMGQRANFALLPMAIASLAQILDWGVENIYANISQTNATIAEAAASFGLQSAPTKYRAGHFLGLEKQGGFSSSLLGNLASENIFVSHRGNSLRITPHVFNTEHDIDRLIDALSRFSGK